MKAVLSTKDIVKQPSQSKLMALLAISFLFIFISLTLVNAVKTTNNPLSDCTVLGNCPNINSKIIIVNGSSGNSTGEPLWSGNLSATGYPSLVSLLSNYCLTNGSQCPSFNSSSNQNLNQTLFNGNNAHLQSIINISFLSLVNGTNTTLERNSINDNFTLYNTIHSTITTPGNGQGICTQAQTGLVALYHFNEGSGSIAIDSSGNGFNGTEINSPVYLSNIIAQCSAPNYDLSFDSGNPDYVDLGTLFSSPPSEFSVQAWIRGNLSDNPGTSFIYSMSDLSTFSNLIYTESGGNFHGYVTTNTGGTPTDSGIMVLDNNWHLVTMTWNGTEQDLYVDGVLGSAIPISGTLDISGSYIASQNGAAPFKGEIDEVSIWNKSLTQIEIQNQFNATNGSIVTNNYKLPILSHDNSSLDNGNGVTRLGNTVSDTLINGNSINFFNQYFFPKTDGSSNQILSTYGNGTLFWSTASSSQDLNQTLFNGNNGQEQAINNISFLSIVNGTNTTLERESLNDNFTLYNFIHTSNITAGVGQGICTNPSDPNLVALYHLNEGSGSTATDATGNGHDGTLQSSPTYFSDSIAQCSPPNYALQFDTTNYVDVPADPTGFNSENLSVFIWVNVSNSNRGFFLGTFSVPNSDGWSIHQESGNVYADFYNINSFVITQSSNIDDGNWHQLGFSIDASTNTIYTYLDGVQTNSYGTSPLASANGDLLIGTTDEGGGVPDPSSLFDGALDEISIWNKTVSPTEVSNMFNASNGSIITSYFKIPVISSDNESLYNGIGENIFGSANTESYFRGSFLSFENNVLHNISDPINPQDAMTLNYFSNNAPNLSRVLLSGNDPNGIPIQAAGVGGMGGGKIDFSPGDPGGSQDGGGVTITAGENGLGALGGQLSVAGATFANAKGGAIGLNGGFGTGSNLGGDVILRGGDKNDIDNEYGATIVVSGANATVGGDSTVSGGNYLVVGTNTTNIGGTFTAHGATNTSNGTLDANAFTIQNLSDPVFLQDAMTLKYFNNNANLNSVLNLGNDAGGNRIINLTDPFNPQDAATKNYADTQINLTKVLASGNNADQQALLNVSFISGDDGQPSIAVYEGVLYARLGTGVIDWSGQLASSKAISFDEQNAITQIGDANNLSLSFGWINNVSDPLRAQDAATKNYTDSKFNNINLTGNITINSKQGIDKNITVVKNSTLILGLLTDTFCDMNFTKGVLTATTC